MEIWKPVKGYESLYEVSNEGRIRSVDAKVWNGHVMHTRKGRILKQYHNSGNLGYLGCVLSKKGKLKSVRIHVLVAQAFLGDRPKGFQVGHLDGNPFNNHANNLRYMTAKENIRQSYQDSGIEPTRNQTLYEFNGETLNASQWARRLGSDYSGLIQDRIKLGWSKERIFTSPAIKPKTYRWRGESKTLSQWSKHLNVSTQTLRDRMERGWGVDGAFSNTPRPMGLTVNGVTKSMSQWSLDLGGDVTLVSKRIRKGWTPEKAVSTPPRRMKRA